MLRQSLTIAVMLAGLTAGSFAAQSKRPDFSGTWRSDPDQSKALTEKNGHPWRVAGAGTGGGQPGANTRMIQQYAVITQSATELIIVRRFDDEIIDRSVYKLDGSLSVNASRSSSSRSTTTWKGDALVTTGTTVVELTGMTKDGKPINEIKRDFVTTRRLMPDGTMQVETRTTQDGEERVTWTVQVRVN